MKKNSGNCLVLICALLFGSAAFQRCFAQDWNSWHYYADVTVQPQADPTYDAVYADFSRLLSHDLHESGALDENSIRVAPVVGGVAGDPVPMRFVKDPGFDASNNASGTLVFQVAETAQVGDVTYRVFFDTQANGPKPAMDGNADVPDKANMIWNGSFEILSQGYTGSNIYANAGNNMPRGWFGNFHNMGLLANLATSAHTGDHVLGFVTPEDHTNVSPLSSPTPPGIRVTSGQSYDFSFWVKGENLTSYHS